MNSRFARFILVAVLASVGLLGQALTAQAQSKAAAVAAPKTPLKADFKGMVGLGMIGAELGFVLPAVAGLDDTWAFIVFPVIGAAGGAAAGYFALEQGDHAELAVASLTLGMALVIPAIVITAGATAYDPEEEAAQTQASAVDSAARARAERSRDPRYAGTGLVRVAEGGVALSAPAVAVIPAAREALDLSRSEVRVSLLSGRF